MGLAYMDIKWGTRAIGIVNVFKIFRNDGVNQHLTISRERLISVVEILLDGRIGADNQRVKI